jgi:hypothetical protein
MTIGTSRHIVEIGSLRIDKTIERTADGAIQREIELPAASAGSLTTRTDDDTGEITLETGHGLSSGTYDVYWDGGVQYGVTATIAGDAMSIDAGSGDNLPRRRHGGYRGRTGPDQRGDRRRQRPTDRVVL